MPLNHVEIKVGSVVIPAGDPAEQLIANLMLSVLAFHADALELGQKHLLYAHSLSANLESLGPTYRGSAPFKVVGITSTTDDQNETLRLPIVGGSLVVPGLSIQQLAKRVKALQTERLTISLQELQIYHYDVRLRPSRVKRSLADIMELNSTERLIGRSEDLLTGCLGDRRKFVDALDLASDYLGLVHNLSSTQNFMLAEMALNQARAALDDWVSSHEDLGEIQPVANFKAKVLQLAEELKLAMAESSPTS